MVHTVGIVGISGNVGKPTAKLLAQAAEQKIIKLVILHREGSNLDGLKASETVELRVINFQDPVEKLAATLSGINVLVSAIAVEALGSEVQLIEALASSKDIVTYIPALFSATWNEENFADPEFAPMLKFANAGIEKAKEKNIGVSQVYNGVFDFFYFQKGYLGSPITGNTIYANEGNLKHAIPLTTMSHLSQALANIATSDPHSVKNKVYSVVTFLPSGQELADLYTKVNGKQAQVKPWSEEDVARLLTTPVQKSYVKHWEKNTFEFEKGGKIVDRSYEGPGLEETARQYVEKSDVNL